MDVTAPQPKLPEPAPAPSPVTPRTRETAKPASAPAPRLDFHVPPILFEGDEPSVAHALPAPPATKVPEPPVLAKDRSPLPAPQLTATGRDPFCIYVSWELGPDRQQRWNALSPDGRLVLRTIMESGERRAQPEIRLNPTSTHWFVTVSSPGVLYSIHLGYYDERRRWCEVARSEPVETPRNAISEISTVQTASLPAAKPGPRVMVHQPAPVIPVLPAPARALTGTTTLAPTVAFTVPPQPEAYSPSERVRTPSAFDLIETHRAEHGERTTSLPAAEVPARSTPLKAQHLPEPSSRMASKVSSPVARRSLPFQDARRVAVSEQILYALASSEEARVPGISSAEQMFDRITRRQHKWVRQEEAITSPGLIEVESREAQPAPSVHVSSPGGEFAPPPAPTRDFWMRVNAELIIYGATLPDAQVAISGRPIKLRPDGTFSYRFALPDGDYRLCVVAVSRDGDDQREAALRFARSTDLTGEVGAEKQDPALRPPKPENL